MNRKIFTRVILLVSFISFFTDIASEMLYPVMPVYLKSIGFSVVLIGVLEGIAECVAGLSKGYFGNLSDKLGSRAVFIRWGYTLSAFAKPLTALSVLPVWIFFVRTLDRIGKGVRTSARDALLSQETTPANKAKVFGFHRGMDTAGAALGPVIALVFLYFFPGKYIWLFIIAFLPGVIAILLTFAIKDKPLVLPTNHKVEKVKFFSFLKYWKQSSNEYKWLVPGLLVFALFNSSDVFLLLALKQNGFSDTQMIGFYIAYNLLYALLSYPFGVLADKIGLSKVFITGLLIFSVVYLNFGFATSTIHFVVLFLLYAVYAATTEGISKAWITNICHKNETATAIGFYNSFQSLAAFAASSIGGLIWALWGMKAMFIFSAIGTLCIFLYFIFFLNKFRTLKTA
jgi:MFS family permease